MKKLFIAIILCLFLVTPVTALDEKPLKQQKFKTVFTVTYNALTLEEASAKEALVRKFCEDACIVDIEIKEQVNENDGNLISFSTAKIWVTDSMGTLTIE